MKKLSSSASGLGDVLEGTKKYNKQMSVASQNLEKLMNCMWTKLKQQIQELRLLKK